MATAEVNAEQQVIQILGTLDADQLEEVCLHLTLDVQDKKGNALLLLKVVLKHLMGTDIQESEDEGLSTFLELKDYMQTLKDKSRLNFPFSTKLKKEEDEDEEDETKKEFRSFFQKEFKITGKIGKPDSKDSLSYSSLIYQIESGFRKGYTESQIIDAIVSSSLV